MFSMLDFDFCLTLEGPWPYHNQIHIPNTCNYERDNIHVMV